MTTSKAPSLSPSEVKRALGRGAALAKANALKPSVADMVSEGVLDHAPTPDAEGRIDTKVVGRDKVVRLLQMSERHYMARQEVAMERQALIRRVPMKGRDGRVRMVAEENEDRSGRKHGSVRLGVFARWGRPSKRPDAVLTNRVPWDWEKQA